MFRVERGEDVAEMIVRRRAVEERTEAPEQVEFHATEPGNIDEGFGPGQHREQCQQEHFLERIHHLAALAPVRHIFEIIEKYNRFGKRAAVCRHFVHGRPPKANPEGRHRFNVLAICHVLLHPIAVRKPNVLIVF